ncbi:hypothetical protein FKG94_08675 [Exilibacterium tricleocarpae]|uniref:Uncharacterized protein n=1 Tax=Exilibacterium tricleocarpae TaxID=2591008 RepID=A0A545TVD0_9GAMM|nr:hypothetical protein [Exilibacterium tricleocarpae]TQV81172.1 hypothetical protein FKG94_08675 [Exilibacterium tricleocarpae]
MRYLLLILLSLSLNVAWAFDTSDIAPYTLKLDGAGNQRIVESVSDDDGNLYLVGYFEDAQSTGDETPSISLFEDTDNDGQRELVAGGSAATDMHTLAGKNRGGRDLFVAKLDWQGELVWLKTAGGEGNDVATGVVYDRRSGKLFISGFFHNIASFGLQELHAVSGDAGLQPLSTSNLFVATLNPVDGQWLEQQALPIGVSIDFGGDSFNALVQGLRLGSDDDTLGNGLVMAANTDNSESVIALYLKGQVLNSHTISPSRTPIGSQVWSASLGLQGQASEHLATFYRPADKEKSTVSAGDWAFAVRLDYIDEPNGALGEQRWNWRWLTRIDTQQAGPQGVELTPVSNCENQAPGSLLKGGALGAAVVSRTLNSDDPHWSDDYGGVDLMAFPRFDFQDPLPAGAKIISTTVELGAFLWEGTTFGSWHFVNINGDSIGTRDTKASSDWRTLYYSTDADLSNYRYGGTNSLALFALVTPVFVRSYSIVFHYVMGDPNAVELCHRQQINTMAIDTGAGLDSDLYFGGKFRGNIRLSSTTEFHSEAGQYNGFVGAIKANGQRKFFSTVGGQSSVQSLLFSETDSRLIAAGYVQPTPDANAPIVLDSFDSASDITLHPQWDNNQSSPSNVLVAKVSTGGRWDWGDISQQGQGLDVVKSRSGDYVLSGFMPTEDAFAIDGSTTQPTAENQVVEFSSAVYSSNLNTWKNYNFAGGTYTITAIRGRYTAWSAWRQTHCTDYNGCSNQPGWLHGYEVSSSQMAHAVGGRYSSSRQQLSVRSAGRYPDEQSALANSRLTAFTLSSDGVVGFAVADPRPNDNRGGMALKVSRVDNTKRTITGRKPLLLGFREKDDASGVTISWRKQGNNDAALAYGQSLHLNNLNTLYFIASSVAGHGQTFAVTHRDSSSADELIAGGSLLNVLDPITGSFLPEFQNYREYIVGQRIDLPAGGVKAQNSISLRKSWINTTAASTDIGFHAPISASSGQAPINTPLLTVNSLYDVYAAGPVERALLLWPTDNSTANVNQPLTGRAVKIRWPTVSEGLQEYLYSVDTDVGLLPVPLNQDTQQDNPQQFAWLHYNATVATSNGGSPSTTGVSTANNLLQASAERMASLVFFAEDDSLQAQPSIVATRSYPWHHTDKFTADLVVDIGKALDSPVSNNAAGGYVMTELARYDVGDPGKDIVVYDRATQQGQIFPVNENGQGDSSGDGRDDGRTDDLYVTWYQTGALGRNWPVQARSYMPQWPSDAGLIALTSMLGSKGLHNASEQDQLTGLNQGNNQPVVYVQNDRSLPGYNPNEEHAFIDPYQGDRAVVHALRMDLNHYPQGTKTSDPYVLVRYWQQASTDYAYRVYRVAFNSSDYPDFNLAAVTAGSKAGIPEYFQHYISALTSHGANGEAFWIDHTDSIWSRSGDTPLQVNYRYHISAKDGFWLDLDGDGQADGEAQTSWLDIYNCQQAQQQNPNSDCSDLGAYTLTYQTRWPDTIPQLAIGDTLFDAIYTGADLRVVYDSSDPFDEQARASTERLANASVRLFNSAAPVRLFAGKLPTQPNGHSYRFVRSSDSQGPVIVVEQVNGAGVVIADVRLAARVTTEGGGLQEYDFPALPSDVRYRLRFKFLPDNKGYFYFVGGQFSPQSGQADVSSDFHMLNVINANERAILQRLDNSGAFPFNNVADEQITPWDAVVQALYIQSRNPHLLDLDGDGQIDDGIYAGIEPVTTIDDEGNTQLVTSNGKPLLQHTTVTGAGALTAAFARQPARVVVASNIDEDSTGPVTLTVVDIVQPVEQGHVNIFHNELNKLDRQLILRQAMDLGGRSEEMMFEWYWHPDVGEPPAIADIALNTDGSPQSTYDSQGTNTGWRRLVGDTATSVVDSGLPLLADGWLLSRYRLKDRTLLNSPYHGWTALAGEAIVPGQPTQPKRMQGWIKRVMSSINAYEQRYSDFHNNNVNSYTSMLQQAGRAYGGDVALNQDNDHLNQIGLIELYQTLLNEARRLSIDADVPIAGETAVYNQLLFAASRIASLYTLIGNEAFSDAMDPTVGVIDNGGNTNTLPPTRFAFENQLASLLDEELALLRGVDNSNSETGNRLLWNFTGGDGEPTYVQVYGLADGNGDGYIEDDARINYPQGHGDAWGHYLSANKLYYSLVRHPNYEWTPLTDSANVLGVDLTVDYKDEELFVKSAAAKARTGARIVDLVFRKHYSHAASGRWQGYKDNIAERAWGMDGWARRAGQGVVLDWALANALLPYEDSDADSDIERLDRKNVPSLGQLSFALQEIEGIVSNADRGNLPVGLAGDAIAFDISASELLEGKSHFEQVYDRAIAAANNTHNLFDYASQISQQIRAKQLTDQEFELLEEAKERAFKTRMIEIFGTPYEGNIGPGKLYPAGYSGPDIYQFDYVDSDLPALPASQLQTVTVELDVDRGEGIGQFFFPYDLYGELLYPNNLNGQEELENHFGIADKIAIDYPLSTSGYPYVKPDASWVSRATTGKVQLQAGQLQLIQAKVNTALATQQSLIGKIQAEIDLLEAISVLRADDLISYDFLNADYRILTDRLAGLQGSAQASVLAGEAIYRTIGILGSNATGPTAVGMSNDASTGGKMVVSSNWSMVSGALIVSSAAFSAAAAATQDDVQNAAFNQSIELKEDGFPVEIQRQLTVIENLMHEEAKIRYNIVELLQEATNARTRYDQLVSEGFGIWAERTAFRKEVASRTTARRYEDMTYRVFRNDALQKYRASFDLATKYAYMAATAFDYETGLLSDNTDVDQSFYEQLIRQRALGQFTGGEPVANVEGLSAPLAAMRDAYQAAGGILGSVDPLVQKFDFSLRREAFRIVDDESGRDRWRALLQNARVANLWDLPQFSQFMVPPGGSQNSALPGIVLRFGTMIDFDHNFFGWPKGAGDTTYPSSYSATKLYRVGLHFDDYPETVSGSPALSTAYAYLVPVGTDLLRSPTDINQLRSYQVMDQYIPAPTNLLASATNNDEIWLPTNGQDWTQRRRVSELEVSTGEVFDFSAVNRSSRLVGRSVWNTEWLLVIPGYSFMADDNLGLDILINGEPTNSLDKGISDIRLVFETYSISAR